MVKATALFAVILLPFTSIAQPGHTVAPPNCQTEMTSSGGFLGYEADGLDTWDLPAGETIHQALPQFKERCAIEIPAAIASQFPKLGIDKNDFVFATDVYSVNIRGVGTSWRCYVDVTIKDPHKYSFTRWKASDQFFDIKDPVTHQVTKTSFEQCKEFTKMLDSHREEFKIFDRHSLLQWVKHKDPISGKPAYLEMCYTTYLQLCGGRTPLN